MGRWFDWISIYHSVGWLLLAFPFWHQQGLGRSLGGPSKLGTVYCGLMNLAFFVGSLSSLLPVLSVPSPIDPPFPGCVIAVSLQPWIALFNNKLRPADAAEVWWDIYRRASRIDSFLRFSVLAAAVGGFFFVLFLSFSPFVALAGLACVCCCVDESHWKSNGSGICVSILICVRQDVNDGINHCASFISCTDGWRVMWVCLCVRWLNPCENGGTELWGFLFFFFFAAPKYHVHWWIRTDQS